MSATTQAAPPPRAATASASAVLAVASGAAFLAMLDATVANLALADLRGDFRAASLSSLTWVITLYAVFFAALLAPAGRLADLVGRRTLLAAGIGLFTAMSLGCAVAPTLGVLLAARALQGAGAALMIPASLGVVLADTPPERRAAAIAGWSAASALAAAAGPALGGVVVDLAGWRAVFFLTVPLGLGLLAATSIVPAAPRVPGRLPDPVGTLLLGAGIGLAALGVSRGADWGWHAQSTLGCLAGSVVAVVAALVRSAGHAAPAIETSLWRTRSFALANLGSLFYGAALFPWLLVGVLVLTQVWGYSPLQAGLAMTPGAIVASVVALRAGPVVARRGPRPVIVGGALVLVGVGLWSGLGLPDHPRFLAFWLPAGVLIGIGTGAITTGLSTAAALSVAPPRFAAATGLNQTARQVGGALGVAALATMLQHADGRSVTPYTHVYLFCAAASGAAALAGLRLVLRR